MSSTGDELSDAESQPRSLLAGYEGLRRSVPPPSAQIARAIPSSPPVEAGASRHEASGSEDDEDSDDSDRENRFEGPASTWRSHTHDERQLIASLDQQRANDLSVHLYNAHALKARLYDGEAVSTAKPWSSKRRWVKPDEDGDVPWQPDRNWTAWPVPAEDVPRREEVFGVPQAALRDQEGTYRKSEPWTPSGDLQEELQALMLRKAKEQFRQRRWATARENAESHLDAEMAPDAKSGTDRLSNEDVSDEDPEDRKPTFASKPEYSQPSLLADDERASSILQPSIRHILAKFDDLLIGLHKSRQGHRRPASASRSRSRASVPRSRSRSAAPVNAPRSRGRSKGKGKGKAAVSDDDEGSNYSPDDESDAPSHAGSSPTRARRKSRPSGVGGHELGLRDWSEVLGIASLVGWDQAVVDRAARRCASLFGEGMSFRTMPETSADHTDDRTVHYVPDMVPVESETESELSDATDEVVFETTIASVWFCPYEQCGRHYKAFEKGWRWREHLRRTHKLRAEQVEEIELARRPEKKANPDRSEASGPGAEGEPGDEDEGSAQADEDGEMVGGVHRDGFLQLVAGTLERGRDAKPRRRRSTNERKGSKRRRLDIEEGIEFAS